jgi:hypothetical protein
MSDYKYEIQMEAERLAEERFGVDFYDLPENEQYNVFLDAEVNWSEKKAAQAEAAYDRSQGF